MAEKTFDGVETRAKTTVFGLQALQETPSGKVLVVVSREGMLKINKPPGSFYGDDKWKPTYQGVSGAGYVSSRQDFAAQQTVDPCGNGTGFPCSVKLHVEFYYDVNDRSDSKKATPVTVEFAANERVKAVLVDRIAPQRLCTLVARLREPKLGSGGSGDVECGMERELERDCGEDPAIAQAVSDLIAKHSPPSPGWLESTDRGRPDFTASFTPQTGTKYVDRRKDLQHPRGFTHNLI